MALKIVVDSSSSFSQEDAKRLNITILPLKIIYGIYKFCNYKYCSI